jgi:hypothetical protein
MRHARNGAETEPLIQAFKSSAKHAHLRQKKRVSSVVTSRSKVGKRGALNLQRPPLDDGLSSAVKLSGVREPSDRRELLRIEPDRA